MLCSASVRICGGAFAVLCLALPAVSRAQSAYAILDLGTLGGTVSVGNAINASGQVAGSANTAGDAATHAVRWTGTTPTDLQTIGTGSIGYGINASGQVAGTVSNPFNHAFRYSGSTMTDLGTLGGFFSQGYAINTSGQVAGYASPSGSTVVRAVIWTGASASILGNLSGGNSEALGINDVGQSAGLCTLAGENSSHAVRWNGITPTDIGTLGGTSGLGYGINATGQIAGWASTVGNAATHAALWTGNTALDLGTLGGTNSYAYSVNAAGDVVGYSNNAGGANVAFIYTKGSMTDLNTLLPALSGWTLTTANAINDNGWITGQGVINGQKHAYLMKLNAVAPGYTVSGYLALEGVTSLYSVSPAAPLGAFHISFRAPGTTTELYGADSTLVTAAHTVGGTYLVQNIPLGVYDVAIKGAKNIQVVVRNVTISMNTALPDVTLPAGDSNNDNSVDSTDFGVIIGAYGGDASVPGSGYDATADFNFDGIVDSTDFGLLIGNFGKTGAP